MKIVKNVFILVIAFTSLLLVCGCSMKDLKSILNNEEIETNKIEKINSSEEDNSKGDSKNIDYSLLKGKTYVNDEDYFTVNDVTKDNIKFEWFLFRTASLETSIKYDSKKIVFYFDGCDDANFDGKCTDEENFIRKATLTLDDIQAKILVEEVDKVGSPDLLVENQGGMSYVVPGEYIYKAN